MIVVVGNFFAVSQAQYFLIKFDSRYYVLEWYCFNALRMFQGRLRKLNGVRVKMIILYISYTKKKLGSIYLTSKFQIMNDGIRMIKNLFEEWVVPCGSVHPK